ncbi:hypothetical protein CF319_g7069 [Tilletia indica]|nr:hypothetical protein CF319_g7069 [Tilletia indica]
MGLVNYYQRYSRNFASVSAPITDLLKHSVTAPTGVKRKPGKRVDAEAVQSLPSGDPRTPGIVKSFKLAKNAPVQWTVQCQQAFDQRTPKTCTVLHPVAFDGRKLTAAELNYPVHEKEPLGVRYALQVWRQYINNGLTVTVVTDHESLKYLPTTKIASKRLARWVADFGEYPLDLVYRRGEDNVIADAISRRPDVLAALGYPPPFLAALNDEPEEIPYLPDYLVSG